MNTVISTEAFSLVAHTDVDGRVRLALIGQLDLAVSDQVSSRVTQCVRGGQPLRLDLSGLEFIDSSGLRALIAGVKAGRGSGQDLVQVDRTLRAQVQRVVDLVGLAPVLWPDELGDGDAAAPRTSPPAA